MEKLIVKNIPRRYEDEMTLGDAFALELLTSLREEKISMMMLQDSEWMCTEDHSPQIDLSKFKKIGSLKIQGHKELWGYAIGLNSVLVFDRSLLEYMSEFYYPEMFRIYTSVV